MTICPTLGQLFRYVYEYDDDEQSRRSYEMQDDFGKIQLLKLSSQIDRSFWIKVYLHNLVSDD